MSKTKSESVIVFSGLLRSPPVIDVISTMSLLPRLIISPVVIPAGEGALATDTDTNVFDARERAFVRVAIAAMFLPLGTTVMLLIVTVASVFAPFKATEVTVPNDLPSGESTPGIVTR